MISFVRFGGKFIRFGIELDPDSQYISISFYHWLWIWSWER